MTRPLILITNDDGIDSTGLWAAVEAVINLGEIVVVAPDRQWSGAGRAMPHDTTGRYHQQSYHINGKTVTAYAVDASPALAVQHGILEFVSRRPALVISGVNYGANLSIEVTISGTVGAALEGAAFGIPALAVSQEMDPSYYLDGDDNTDYTTARVYTRRFARYLLSHGLPMGIDALNLNIPAQATPLTPWRQTHLSRHRYFTPLRPDRKAGKGRPGYRLIDNAYETEPDSDIHTLLANRMVSLTPLSLDMTARVNSYTFSESLTAELLSYQAVRDPAFTAAATQPIKAQVEVPV